MSSSRSTPGVDSAAACAAWRCTAASIQQLSPSFRSRLTAVAPLAADEGAPGFFTAHAVDCVNLIALAAAEAETDAPSEIRLWMAPVSGGGRQCTTFEGCIDLLERDLPVFDDQGVFQTFFRYRDYGAGLTASYPLDKFRRLEANLSVRTVSQLDIADTGSEVLGRTFIFPSVEYVKDVTRPGYLYPMGGHRYGIGLSGSPGFIPGTDDIRETITSTTETLTLLIASIAGTAVAMTAAGVADAPAKTAKKAAKAAAPAEEPAKTEEQTGAASGEQA